MEYQTDFNCYRISTRVWVNIWFINCQRTPSQSGIRFLPRLHEIYESLSHCGREFRERAWQKSSLTENHGWQDKTLLNPQAVDRNVTHFGFELMQKCILSMHESTQCHILINIMAVSDSAARAGTARHRTVADLHKEFSRRHSPIFYFAKPLIVNSALHCRAHISTVFVATHLVGNFVERISVFLFKLPRMCARPEF